MKVKLTNVRLAFPDLFVPRPFKPGDPPKFKATFLIPKDDPQVKAIEAAILVVAKEKWGAKAQVVLGGIRGNPNKFNFQDGDAKEYDGYSGQMALSAGNKVRPLVIDRNKSPLTESDGRPYPGCYVNASVEFFAYDNSGNGISASLKGVQFAGDGDAFVGSPPATSEEFEDIAVGEDALT